MKRRELKLTSRFGTFYFYSDVILSHAKLIRDTVTGQHFFPALGLKRINTAQEAYELIHGLPASKALNDIPFSVVLNQQ